jgi:ParB family transcriptional regulator, chromosome partitioning protein
MTQAVKRYITGKLYELTLKELSPDTTQPRKYFDEQAMAELQASIEKHGVLQPVLVRHGENGGFLIVSGERRYLASLAAGLSTIPAIITHGNPVEISIVENLLRENLTAIEEAEAIDHLKNTHNYQLSDLAGVLGKAESTISEILSLVKLPPAVKDDCRNDPKAARGILAEIAKQSTVGKMSALYKKYKDNGLTRGEIRSKITRIKLTPAPAPMNLAFVGKFTKNLSAMEIADLDPIQYKTFMADLTALRSELNKKFRALRALPIGS